MRSNFTFCKFRVCLWLAAGALFLLAAVSIPARAQNIQWIRQFGTAGSDSANGVAVDATGFSIAGYTEGGFPGSSNHGAGDPFLRRYDANGTALWTRLFGSSERDSALGVAVDSTGSYVVGYLTSRVYYGLLYDRYYTEQEAFVGKYDTNGNQLWLKRPGNTGFYGVAADSTGIYVGGVGNTTTHAPVSKYNASGTVVWTSKFGPSGNDSVYVRGVAVDATGVYVVGYTYGSLPGQTTSGSGDAFIAKIGNGGGGGGGGSYGYSYYLPHLALGGGWQTTITYVNYSPQTVTCATTFYSDSGGPLSVSFGGAAASSRTDTLVPGGVVHTESTADLNASEVRGWAKAQCSGPITASLLFRSYQQGKPTGEAGVNATTTPATRFVTFAAKQTGGVATGVAYANPSTQTAQLTFNAFSSTGVKLASNSLSLLPGQHGASLLDSLLGLSSFTGSIEITSKVPIVSLSLNFEAFPAFSSLPPGERDALPTGVFSGGQLLTVYNFYFPHLALGGGWQTTLTFVNSTSQTVTCTTTFFSDSGGPLSVSFGGAAASSRTDTLAPWGVIHQETNADLNAPEVRGWAKAQCSGPIKASLLFRFYQQGKPTGEAGVNAMTASATKFVTFSDQTTGVAYANPSTTQTAEITFTAISSTGTKLATKSLPLLPGEHGAKNVGPFLGISSFTGSIQIVVSSSRASILSLSLNAEAFPAFSSLPPGELDGSTPLW